LRRRPQRRSRSSDRSAAVQRVVRGKWGRRECLVRRSFPQPKCCASAQPSALRAASQAREREAPRARSQCTHVPRPRSGSWRRALARWAVLDMLSNRGVLGLAHFIAEVLLQILPGFLAAAIAHFMLLVAAVTIPRSAA